MAAVSELAASIAAPFPEALAKVKEAFKAEGFGALTEIDVKATLKEKLGQEMEPYTIIGMCNPALASRAIAAEHEIGVFLPCNVLVHECGGAVHVTAQDPRQMMQMAGSSESESELRPVAEEVRQRIERALGGLKT